MTVIMAESRVITVTNEDSHSEVSSVDEEDHVVENDGEETGNEDSEYVATNEAWADSIAKILKSNKPKGKKTLVLSKAKKLTDIKPIKVKPAGYQLATANGEVKEEKIETNEQEERSGEPERKKRRELPNLRVKPNILDKDRERTLQKIATKGVVQLFNAVKMQQKDINKKLEEAGPLEFHKEKVLKNIDKRAFLDILMGEKSKSITVDDDDTQDKQKTSTPQIRKDAGWDVLRDDFMMSAKMKDWDKELEETEELEEENEEIESE